MAVLEGAREECARRRQRLERGAVVAEADDDGTHVESSQRFEQHLHALVLDQLPDVDDGRHVARERSLEACRVAAIGMTLVLVLRILLGRGDQLCERAQAVFGDELLDIDAGRHLVHAVDVADDVLENGSDVRRADEDGVGARERLRSPARELLAPAHRILELRAVRLHGVARTRRRSDGSAEQDMVREDDVGRQQLAQRGGVRIDVARALLRGEVLQQLRLEPLVAVEHEYR